MLDSTSSLEEKCVKRGLKMTEQRRVIARIISSSEDHPSIDEIYLRASKIDMRISIATVYRTINLFEEHNIIQKLDLKDGVSRYEELNNSHHHHLVDIETNQIIEFENEELEIMKHRIAHDLGYELVDHRLELYGKKLK